MKDHPIAFAPAMVSAILARRKWQTRRIFTGHGARYAVGDLLWIRETHYFHGHWTIDRAKTDADGGKLHWHFKRSSDDLPLFDWPKQEPRPPYGFPKDREERLKGRWYTRPAMFMPMRYARIILQIKEVYQQPLQAITPMDAREEGICALSKDGKTLKFGIPDRDGLPGRDDEGWPWDEWQKSAVLGYAHLWSKLHGTIGPKSWDANPTVSRIVFSVETRPL